MLTEFLLDFALLGAEWVLWILVLLSVATVAFTIERILFFRRRAVAVDELRVKMEECLEDEDYEAAADLLEGRQTMEARVVLFGLRDREKGPEAVEDRMSGALSTEKTKYNQYLPFLGTVGNNAPFIGLFGTVLGIIAAFDNLAIGSQEAAQGVMGAISEALVATGVGLLVAIPAVIAFNAFKTRVGKSVAQTDLLGRTLLSYLRRDD